MDNLIIEYRQALAKIILLIGLRQENIPTNEQRDYIVNWMMNNMKFSPADFVEAFEMGVRGKLSIDMKTYQVFSILYLEDVMKAYSVHRHEREESVINTNQLTQNCEKTEYEKDLIIWNGIHEAFARFKATGEKVTFGSVKYDFLKCRGMIPFTKERRNKMMELAKNRVKMEFEVKITTARTINDMRKLQEQINNNGKDYQARCVEEAKTIAINTLFAEMVESGTEINDLIPA